MDRAILGDNPFFGVNHSSDERARAQSIAFRDTGAIVRVLDESLEIGVRTFMCTTHDRMAEICDHLRAGGERYADFRIYPCMPYAHKYANAVTELGPLGALRRYLPASMLPALARGGLAAATHDHVGIMKVLVDAEMRMFRGLRTDVVFLQNVVTDLLLGLGMRDLLLAFAEHVASRHRARPGFITMNLPRLQALLGDEALDSVVICASINRIGFRMPGGRECYERALAERRCRVIAMQALAAGALSPGEAMDYVCRLPGVDAVVFGASSAAHIRQTRDLIERLSGAPPATGQ